MLPLYSQHTGNIVAPIKSSGKQKKYWRNLKMKDDIKDFINDLEEFKAKDNQGFMSMKNEILKLICNVDNNEVSNVLNDRTKELLLRQNKLLEVSFNE